MNVKKTAIAAVSYAMVAALAIGGTLAYQTDQTPTAKNVMPLGDVDIVQNEYQRVDDKENQTKLEDFKQLKEVKPAYYTGTSIPWAPEDQWVEPGNQAWKVVEDNPAVIDKFVTVENIGSNDAYVRTVFAIEVGPNAVNDPYMHVVTNGTNIKDGPTWNWEWPAGVVEIDGGSYVLAVATYTGALAPGQSTIPSLKQIYLDKTATNEVVKAYGDTYEILVFSQAVQTDMGTADGNLTAAESLNEAFGEITTTSHPWTETAFVDSAEELSAALAAGGEVVLTADIAVDEIIKIEAGVKTELNLNGFDIAVPEANADTGRSLYAIDNYGELTLTGAGTIEARGIENFGTMTIDSDDITIVARDANGGAAIWNEGVLTINGGTFTTGTVDDGAMSDPGALNNQANGTVVINGGTFDGNGALCYAIINSGNMTINNATVTGRHGVISNDGTLVIEDGVYSCEGVENQSDHCVYYYGGTVTINGGTFTHDREGQNGSAVFYNNGGILVDNRTTN